MSELEDGWLKIWKTSWNEIVWITRRYNIKNIALDNFMSWWILYPALLEWEQKKNRSNSRGTVDIQNSSQVGIRKCN